MNCFYYRLFQVRTCVPCVKVATPMLTFAHFVLLFYFAQESDKLKDDDLYKFLADLKRPSSVLKRLKCIPGNFSLHIINN